MDETTPTPKRLTRRHRQFNERRLAIKIARDPEASCALTALKAKIGGAMQRLHNLGNPPWIRRMREDRQRQRIRSTRASWRSTRIRSARPRAVRARRTSSSRPTSSASSGDGDPPAPTRTSSSSVTARTT